MAVYDSLADVPLDEYHGDDGDDQRVPSEEVPFDAPRILQAAGSAVTPDPHLVVPYVYAKAGDRGPHIKALKRALSRAGYGTWLGSKFTSLLGPFAVRSLNAYKRKLLLPANGVYDKATHQKLAGFYDAYAIKYLLNAQVVKPTADQLRRNAFIAELMYLYNRRGSVQYTQRRAFDTAKPPYGLDCSASGEWAAKWCGMKSLSGYSSFGFGNTDSQIQRYRNLNAARASVVTAVAGDPVYYGRNGDPSHVAFYIGAGRVWSFGAYPIKLLAYDYRHDRIGFYNLTAGQ